VTSSKVEREGSRRSASLTAQSFLVDLIASLRLWSVSWWYAASPQEKSNRATDMPALRQAEMVSTERDLGPSVPTILVMAGKKLCPPTQVNRYGLGGCVRRRSIPPDLSSRAKKKGKKGKERVLTVLDGSRMEAIRMGSSSSRFVECIVARASDQIGRASGGACTGDGDEQQQRQRFFSRKEGKRNLVSLVLILLLGWRRWF
jgi:hypothetical protein